MTNGELATICTAITGGFTILGASIRWSAGIIKAVAGRVVKSIDDSTDASKQVADKIGQFTTALVRVELKLDQAHAAAVDAKASAENVEKEITRVHSVPPAPPAPPALEVDVDLELAPPQPFARARTGATPIGGVPVRRTGTKGGG